MSNKLRTGSVCTGYGGLDLGVKAAIGGNLLWVADNNPAASKVLAERFPMARNWGDLRTIQWGELPAVDVLAAGTPCQDFSLAGARKGLSGDRSSLWRDFMEGVRQIGPKVVIWENVPGARSVRAAGYTGECPVCLGYPAGVAMRALGCVLADLASAGFDAEWCSVRASGVGACHQRERVFVLAWQRSPDALGLLRDLWREHGPGASTSSSGNGVSGGRGGFPALFVGTEYEGAVRRHVESFGAAPPPREWGRTRERLSVEFVEWVMMLPAGWVTGVPGLSRRDVLTLLGNGVVPRQAEYAVRVLLRRAVGEEEVCSSASAD